MSDDFSPDGFSSDGGDAFRDWDAAYVMGALSPDERRDYELHLEGCEYCAAAVAELAGLPALLSKVAPAEASALLDDGEALLPPATLLPRLVHTVRRRHRRRVVVSTLGLVAVAAAILLVVPMLAASPLLQTAVPSAAPTTAAVSQAQIALEPVVPSPLRASIRLVPQPWGTRVEMDCRYADHSADSGYGGPVSADYAMYVTDAAGKATQIATWTAGPGQNTEPAGTTSLRAAQIASVDVRAVSTGAVLLRGSP
jgi:hypothetical protein